MEDVRQGRRIQPGHLASLRALPTSREGSGNLAKGGVTNDLPWPSLHSSRLVAGQVSTPLAGSCPEAPPGPRSECASAELTAGGRLYGRGTSPVRDFPMRLCLHFLCKMSDVA